MPTIPAAEYRPDRPELVDAGSQTILNVLPRTGASYGPFPGLAPFSTGTNPIARVQGAYACLDTAGNVNIFAGDATKLYRLQAGGTTFADVSKAAGYSVATDGIWSFTLFGSRVIATDLADNIQSFVLGSSTTFADMIASGSTTLRAKYVIPVRDWVMLLNTSDGINGAQPQRAWWSAIDDPTNFPTPGTSAAAAVQSDFQDIVGDFGWIQGGVGNLGTADACVFLERAVYRIVYVGPPAIFSFQPAEGVRGTPAPGSIVQVGNIAYYLGEDGFYAFDGSASRPIGAARVDKTFFADLDQSYFYRITAAADPINKIVYWAYPGAGHTGGNPNRILAYNWSIDRWSVTAANAIQIEFLFRSLTPGFNLETLDSVVPNIDTGTQLSFDSRIYTKGRSALVAFDTTHVLNTFGGANLAPIVETTETELFPGQRSVINYTVPLVDGGTPAVAIGTRNRQTDAVSYANAVPVNGDGFAYTRTDGRFIRARVTLPAGTSFTHIYGVDFPLENEENPAAVPGGIR